MPSSNVADRVSPLSRTDEISLARRIEQGDTGARDRLVEANLGLVKLIAVRYRGYGVPLSDLVQEGAIGLLQAASRYDHRREVRFATYATWRVRSRILDTLASSSLIRPPARPNRYPTAPVARVVISLDATSVDPGETVGAQIADERIHDPVHRVIAVEESSELARWLGVLPARYLEILRRRYGLAGHRPQSHRQIAMHLGLGEDRCRQLEREALQRLRTISGAHTTG